MQTIAKAALRSGKMGEPLPDLYECQIAERVSWRRGATSMVAGPPGSYKSTLALNMTVQWALQGMTAVYVSADSDAHTVAKRCAGILTGDPMDVIDPPPPSDPSKPYTNPLRAGVYTNDLRRLSNIHWEFRGLNVSQLDNRLKTFETMYGDTPDLVVLDNLMNCVDGPSDFSGQITMCRDLDEVARAARCHIMILHHTKEMPPGKGPIDPPARWEIQGKVAQFPRLILTMAAEAERLKVATVKNTNGPQDATGRTYADFVVNPDNARISEVIVR